MHIKHIFDQCGHWAKWFAQCTYWAEKPVKLPSVHIMQPHFAECEYEGHEAEGGQQDTNTK